MYVGGAITTASLRKVPEGTAPPTTIFGWFVLYHGVKTTVIKLIQYFLSIPQVPWEKFTIWLCAALLLKPIDSFSAPLRKHHAYSKDCSWVMILAQKERHPGLLLTQASPLPWHLKHHCRAPAIYFSDLLLNCCAWEEACSTAQRGPEMTDVGDFKLLKAPAPASRSRQTGTLS